jgi:hypothetical protein
MKKTDAILQFLAQCDGPQTTSAIAAAIDDPDGVSRVSALLTYLAGLRRITKGEQIGRENAWSITDEGRAWFGDVQDEAGENVGSAPAPRKVVKAARLPAKVQRKTAKAKPAAAVAFVEPTPLPPANGRQLAVRDDGAILLIEDDVVVTTLIPEDALRIAKVIERLAA